MNEMLTVLPEATLTALACLVLIIDVFRRADAVNTTFWAAVFSVLLVLSQVALYFPEEGAVAFAGTFVLDPMAAVLKSFMLVVMVLSFFYARDYFQRRGSTQTEFYILALFAGIGMMVLISAHNLLTVYLGLELLSLSLYAMVAMSR
ncbi:MAG: NADH:ubiquinone oxidoreductase subunit N, partial [Gammaproteobacteria bacterium]